MGTILRTVGLSLMLVWIGAGDAAAFGSGAGTVVDVANEKQIRKLYENFTAAWNSHEASVMGPMYTIDADHIEPDGTVAKGRLEVGELLVKQHATVFKDTQLELTVETVWFIRGDVALVDGTYSISGIRGLDGNEIPARGGHLTSVLIKEREKWGIAASRLMIPTGLPYKKDK